MKEPCIAGMAKWCDNCGMCYGIYFNLISDDDIPFGAETMQTETVYIYTRENNKIIENWEESADFPELEDDYLAELIVNHYGYHNIISITRNGREIYIK